MFQAYFEGTLVLRMHVLLGMTLPHILTATAATDKGGYI